MPSLLDDVEDRHQMRPQHGGLQPPQQVRLHQAVCPVGCTPGMPVTFPTPNGRMTVKIPQGVSPGMTFQFHAPMVKPKQAVGPSFWESSACCKCEIPLVCRLFLFLLSPIASILTFAFVITEPFVWILYPVILILSIFDPQPIYSDKYDVSPPGSHVPPAISEACKAPAPGQDPNAVRCLLFAPFWILNARNPCPCCCYKPRSPTADAARTKAASKEVARATAEAAKAAARAKAGAEKAAPKRPPIETEPYTVTNGDTFMGIALRHGISSGKLRRLNELSRPQVWPGQIIKVPAASEGGDDDAQPAARATAEAAKAAARAKAEAERAAARATAEAAKAAARAKTEAEKAAATLALNKANDAAAREAATAAAARAKVEAEKAAATLALNKANEAAAREAATAAAARAKAEAEKAAAEAAAAAELESAANAKANEAEEVDAGALPTDDNRSAAARASACGAAVCQVHSQCAPVALTIGNTIIALYALAMAFVGIGGLSGDIYVGGVSLDSLGLGDAVDPHTIGYIIVAFAFFVVVVSVTTCGSVSTFGPMARKSLPPMFLRRIYPVLLVLIIVFSIYLEGSFSSHVLAPYQVEAAVLNNTNPSVQDAWVRVQDNLECCGWYALSDSCGPCVEARSTQPAFCDTSKYALFDGTVYSRHIDGTGYSWHATFLYPKTCTKAEKYDCEGKLTPCQYSIEAQIRNKRRGRGRGAQLSQRNMLMFLALFEIACLGVTMSLNCFGRVMKQDESDETKTMELKAIGLTDDSGLADNVAVPVPVAVLVSS